MVTPNHQYQCVHPPRIWGVRYRTIFLILQIINAIRFYICPDSMNIKLPTYTNLTLVCVLVPNALAFLHGLDGNKRNWETVQGLMIVAALIYIMNIALCIYLSTYTDRNSEECWMYIWDQAIYWNEVFIIIAMHALAKGEARYFHSIEYLDKTNAEYGSINDATKRKKKRNGLKTEKEPEDPTKYSKIKGPRQPGLL